MHLIWRVFFQFGGAYITFPGEECIVDFSEKMLRSKSGKNEHLKRMPPIVDLPEQNPKFHISGQDYNIKNAHSKLLDVLNGSLVKTAPIPWSIESEFSFNIKQQIKKLCQAVLCLL